MRRMSDTSRVRAALYGLIGFGVVTGLSVAWSVARTAHAATPQDLVNSAYTAMGGDKLNGIILKAHLEQFDPGESWAVSDPLKPDRGASDLVYTRGATRGVIRLDWVRPKVDGSKRTFTEIVTTTGGYITGDDAVEGRLPKRTIKGTEPPLHTMSGKRLTVTLRELQRAAVVAAMKLHPDRVSAMADQTVEGKKYPAVRYRGDYGTFIVMFDPATNLPVRVRTLDWDDREGDSIYDAEYSDWRDVGGEKIAFHTLYTLNGVKIIDMKISEATPNPTLAANTFDIPKPLVGTAAKPAPPNETPFQWIIRRQFVGFYFDSDALYTDDGDALKIYDVGPNVSQIRGGTHNTVFIATDKYLVAVESPNDDGQSIQSIALAKQKYPGKPVRYLILTHAHVDHVGGMRTYAAEGATIVVGKGSGEYFRKVLARPETLNPEAPKKKFAAEVIEVDGKWSVNDGGREIDAYSLDNPHAASFLFPYVPDAKIGIVTDLYTPGAPVTSNPMVLALVNGVKKMGIQPQTIVGGHGTVGPYADVLKAVEKTSASATR
jgi:glyoxylase-like metal-dependent hydrolase (beta-lactamase superfamily II)